MQTTLLVEDASFFEKAIVKKLHEVGRHQIMVARSYSEAENCLDLPIGDPDLALVDLTLPAARRIDIEYADGDRTEITFNNIVMTSGIRDDEVALAVPANVREEYPLGRAGETDGAAGEGNEDRGQREEPRK